MEGFLGAIHWLMTLDLLFNEPQCHQKEYHTNPSLIIVSYLCFLILLLLTIHAYYGRAGFNSAAEISLLLNSVASHIK